MSIFNFKKKEKVVNPPTSAVADSGVTKPGEKQFVEGLVSTKDIIAPSALEVDFDDIHIGNKYYRTLFVAGYPRFVGMNWLSPLINFDASQTISMYIYPTDGKAILDDLRRKIAEMEAEISTDIQRGKVVNPATQAKLEDALTLQADLVKGEERFFQYGLYVTVAADTKEEINRITKNLEASLGALLIISKKATLQMEEGFITTLPLCSDKISITRNMDTTSLATTFPFVSSDLSDDKGIMYGINEHNGSLVIFDRFSMPNYNSVVFASAGAGKSYLIKLEAIRSLMLGAEIIVIDPENEYRNLAEAAGGQYIAFGYGEESKINPFDLSLVEEEGENALNSKILSLHKLFTIMLGALDPIEESILDRAIMDAYKMKGITPDPETQTREPPLIEDLYKSLIGMEDKAAQMIAARMEKYIKGSFAGIFNQKTTVNLTNKFVVFGIRNLEETLRPVAMHIILDYIWTVVKKTLKKRILIVDEAWYLMQYPDSAAFLRGIVKRGRKYYLGVTTITQDVDDFLETPYGKEIVTNSSIQILLKQHSAAIDQVGQVFYLSEGEKQLLLTADKGEGIFFAGQNHVAIKVIASEDEHRLITSNPEEVMKMKQAGKVPGVEVMKPDKSEIVRPVSDSPAPVKINEEVKVNQPVNATPTTPIPIIAPLVATSPTQDSELKSAPISVQIPTKEPIKEVTVTQIEKASPNPSPDKTEAIINEVQKDDSRNMFKAEVVGSAEDLMQKRIAEMEEKEKQALEEHKKKVEAESAAATALADKEKKLQGSFGSPMGGFGSGGLPKYQDLFKSSNNGGGLPKLPPLPPLPKFDLPKTTDQSKPFKTEVINENKPVNKPVFINKTEETKIPQPAQLQKKPKPEFVSENTQIADSSKQIAENSKPADIGSVVDKPAAAEAVADKSVDANKMDYDKLFGNGIV